MVSKGENKICSTKQLDLKMEINIMTHLQVNTLFPSLQDHFYDHEIGVEDSHLTSLVRQILRSYLRIRFHHYGKSYTRLVNGDSRRHHLNKLILFLHQ